MPKGPKKKAPKERSANDPGDQAGDERELAQPESYEPRSTGPDTINQADRHNERVVNNDAARSRFPIEGQSSSTSLSPEGHVFARDVKVGDIRGLARFISTHPEVLRGGDTDSKYLSEAAGRVTSEDEETRKLGKSYIEKALIIGKCRGKTTRGITEYLQPLLDGDEEARRRYDDDFNKILAHLKEKARPSAQPVKVVQPTSRHVENLGDEVSRLSVRRGSMTGYGAPVFSNTATQYSAPKVPTLGPGHTAGSPPTVSYATEIAGGRHQARYPANRYQDETPVQGASTRGAWDETTSNRQQGQAFRHHAEPNLPRREEAFNNTPQYPPSRNNTGAFIDPQDSITDRRQNAAALFPRPDPAPSSRQAQTFGQNVGTNFSQPDRTSSQRQVQPPRQNLAAVASGQTSARHQDDQFQSTSNRAMTEASYDDTQSFPSLGRNPSLRGNAVPSMTVAVENKLDPSFKKKTPREAGAFFKIGRVFAMMLHSERTGGNASAAKWTLKTAHGPLFTHVCRFAVVREGHGYAWCIPIHTYQGQGVKKKGFNKKDIEAHAIIYMEGTRPMTLNNEPSMPKRPIAVKPAGGETLVDASRIDFARVHTVEHNVSVKNVGYVTDHSRPYFDAYWKESRGL